MLLSFTVENFKSYRDTQSLILEPEKRLKVFEENIYTSDGYRVLKTAAIFGHNASGKSNILEAIFFMRYIVVNSKNDELLPYLPFLYRKDTKEKPTLFEIEAVVAGKRYRYGFTYTANEILSEWLFVKDKKERYIFTRTKDDYKINSELLKGVKAFTKSTGKKSLFLSVCSFLQVADVKGLFEFIANLDMLVSDMPSLDAMYSRKIVVVSLNRENKDQSMRVKIAEFARSAEDRENKDQSMGFKIAEFARSADLSIQDIYSVKKSEKHDKEQEDYSIVSVHNIYDEKNMVKEQITVDFDSFESVGTKKFVNISHDIISALESGGVYIIDELDAQLHPVLVFKIIELFNSSETNPKGAQLIFTTHCAEIMDRGMRKDQIFFVEKDEVECSRIFPLSAFKFTGNKAPEFLSKAYLFGRYGAVPSI